MPKITSIPSRILRRVFEEAGFKCVRVEGDHFVYTKKGVSGPVVIPDWKEVPVFIIKNNLRTAGITREEYFSLLDEILSFEIMNLSVFQNNNLFEAGTEFFSQLGIALTAILLPH